MTEEMQDTPDMTKALFLKNLEKALGHELPHSPGKSCDPSPTEGIRKQFQICRRAAIPTHKSLRSF